jgi:hypothetical protein
MCLREKIGPDPRNFNQRVSLGRNDLLIRTFLGLRTNSCITLVSDLNTIPLLNWKILIAPIYSVKYQVRIQ